MPSSNPKVPRLIDVAKAADVSLATASRVLNGDSDSFGTKTQEKVRKAASDLGWRRNLLVDSIQKGRTKTVGVMIPPHDSFWNGVLAGIHMELATADYLPITIWTGDCREYPEFGKNNDKDAVALINRLLDRRVDGIILWPSFAVAYYEHYRALMDRRIPVVVIDHKLSDEDIADSIETDEEQGTRLVAEHLLSLGHREIACFSAREVDWQSWSIRRRSLFERAVQELSGTEVVSYKTNAKGDNAMEVATEILSATPRHTAVFAVTDHMARFLYRAARQLGLKIPEDVSIVGYADLEFNEDLSPSLTSVRQNPKKIGQLAAKSVLDRLSDKSESAAPAKVRRVSTELISRESTATCPVS